MKRFKITVNTILVHKRLISNTDRNIWDVLSGEIVAEPVSVVVAEKIDVQPVAETIVAVDVVVVVVEAEAIAAVDAEVVVVAVVVAEVVVVAVVVAEVVVVAVVAVVVAVFVVFFRHILPFFEVCCYPSHHTTQPHNRNTTVVPLLIPPYITFKFKFILIHSHTFIHLGSPSLSCAGTEVTKKQTDSHSTV